MSLTSTTGGARLKELAYVVAVINAVLCFSFLFVSLIQRLITATQEADEEDMEGNQGGRRDTDRWSVIGSSVADPFDCHTLNLK